MKKIYFILPDLAAGGAERVTINIARILKKDGRNVAFINLGYNIGDMLTWIEPEFEMVNFGCNRVLNAIPCLMKFMKCHKDCLFFSSREHVNIVGLLSAKLIGCQMIVRIPNMPKNNLTTGISGLKMRVIRMINRRLLPTAKTIIAQNDEMRKQLLEYYHLPDYIVVAINNPVDKENVIASANGSKNPFNAQEVNFLNVSNIAYSKGIDVLIESWDLVKQSIPNAHLYIVGRNTSDYAQHQMDKMKSRKDFTFLGFINNPYPYIKHCDVFVLPSRMEGFPNVVLEAMCFNRPIASTTCVEVIKDIIIPAVNGYYCDIENVSALAEAMINASKLTAISNDYNLFDREKLVSIFQ